MLTRGAWRLLVLGVCAVLAGGGCAPQRVMRGEAASDPASTSEAPGDGIVYHFEHLTTGARKLRGGSFPGEIPVYPRLPRGVNRSPEIAVALRMGTIRVPARLLGVQVRGEQERDALVPRFLAIDDAPSDHADQPVPFWVDFDGDGDLTNNPVEPDAHARDAARDNPQLTSLLTRVSTGVVALKGERHAYVAGKIRDLFYLFVAPEVSLQDVFVFDWKTAVGLVLEAPPWVERVPSEFKAPMLGVFRVGVREQPLRFLTALDLPGAEDSEPPRLVIDSNADGLLDEWPIALKRAPIPPRGADSSHQERWVGTAKLEVSYPAPSGAGALGQGMTRSLDLSLDLRIERHRGNHPEDASPRVSLSYRGDWGRRGLVRLAGKEYPALLFDELASGDYRGSLGGNDRGVRLLIDLDGDGKFGREEAFDVGRAITALGVTYEIRDLEPSGESFRLEKVEAGHSGER